LCIDFSLIQRLRNLMIVTSQNFFSKKKKKLKGMEKEGEGQVTTKVKDRFLFDPSPLEKYLQEQNLPNFTLPLEIRQFSIGQSNPTFLLVTKYFINNN